MSHIDLSAYPWRPWQFSIYLRLFKLRSRDSPSQTQITKLDIAVIIYQDIGWFQVSMNNGSRVKVLCSAEHVVGNDFDVVFGHAHISLARDQGVQVFTVVLLN